MDVEKVTYKQKEIEIDIQVFQLYKKTEKIYIIID